MSARFDSDYPDTTEVSDTVPPSSLPPLPEEDSEVLRGLFSEVQIAQAEAHLLHSLDDLAFLTKTLPFEVKQNCMDAFRQGKHAEDMAEWGEVNEQKMYIRGRLIHYGIIQ